MMHHRLSRKHEASEQAMFAGSNKGATQAAAEAL